MEAVIESNTRDYHAYWNLRNNYDSDADRVKLSQEERDFYADPETITTLENSRTTQYHELDPIWTLAREMHPDPHPRSTTRLGCHFFHTSWRAVRQS